MKKFLMGTILLTSACSVQAADWTPIIESWADNYCISNSETEAAIMASVTEPGIDNHSIDKLSKNAKRGHYPKVPKPYRHDLLPAIITETTPGFEPGSAQKITIPLKNATYGDIPLKSLDFVTEVDSDNIAINWYKAYNFGRLDIYQIVKLMQMSRGGLLSGKRFG